MFVSDGAELIAWPATPASGWTVKLAGQNVVVSADGSFTLTAPSDATLKGSVCHPTDTELSQPEFSWDGLGTTAGDAQILFVPIFFHGPCGMNEGEDPIRARFYNPLIFDPAKPQWPGITTGPIPGTSYPRPDSVLRNPSNAGCPSMDGFLGDGTRVLAEEKYPGSTCDLAVLDGACPNENCLSDLEYKNLFTYFPSEFSPGSVLGKLYQSQGGGLRSAALTPPSKITGSGPTGVGGACFRNHGGRSCGEFKIGDVALAVGSAVALPGQQLSVRIPADQASLVTVHNYGAFGFTDIRATKPDPLIKIGAATLKQEADVQRLGHFMTDPDRLTTRRQFIYLTDQALRIEVDPTALPGQTATYTCTVDNETVTLTVTVGSPVAISPPSATLPITQVDPTDFSFSGPAVQELAAFLQLPVVDSAVSTALYRWSVSGNAGGTISAVGGDGQVQQGTTVDTTATTANYIKSPAAQVGQADTVKLEVFIKRGGILTSFGSATAQVSLGANTPIRFRIDTLVGDKDGVRAALADNGTLAIGWIDITSYGPPRQFSAKLNTFKFTNFAAAPTPTQATEQDLGNYADVWVSLPPSGQRLGVLLGTLAQSVGNVFGRLYDPANLQSPTVDRGLIQGPNPTSFGGSMALDDQGATNVGWVQDGTTGGGNTISEVAVYRSTDVASLASQFAGGFNVVFSSSAATSTAPGFFLGFSGYLKVPTKPHSGGPIIETFVDVNTNNVRILQIYPVTGNPIGAPYAISPSLELIGSCDSSMNDAGDLVVVWSEVTYSQLPPVNFVYPDPVAQSVFYRRFKVTDSSLTEVSSAKENGPSGSNQVDLSPLVAVDGAGNFVIAWQRFNGPAQVRRFTAANVGGNEATLADFKAQSLCSDSLGNCVVAGTDPLYSQLLAFLLPASFHP